MSDSSKIWDVTLTDEDAEAFLRERIPTHSCKNCSHDTFKLGLVPPGGNEYLSIWTTRDIGGFGTNHLPIFTVACQNCGLTEVYSAGPLVEWKKAKQEAPSNGDA